MSILNICCNLSHLQNNDHYPLSLILLALWKIIFSLERQIITNTKILFMYLDFWSAHTEFVDDLSSVRNMLWVPKTVLYKSLGYRGSGTLIWSFLCSSHMCSHTAVELLSIITQIVIYIIYISDLNGNTTLLSRWYSLYFPPIIWATCLLFACLFSWQIHKIW